VADKPTQPGRLQFGVAALCELRLRVGAAQDAKCTASRARPLGGGCGSSPRWVRNFSMTVRFLAQSAALRMSLEARNDSSASGSLRASSLQRRLSGGESDWPVVAARPKPADQVAPKQPDGEPSPFLFRVYEAVGRDLTDSATSGRSSIKKVLAPATGPKVKRTVD
jgi:hypothetical protein